MPSETSRTRSRSRATPASGVAAYLLAALVVALPLARGGVPEWAQALAALATCVAVLLAAGAEPAVPWAGVALLPVVALIGLQAIPLGASSLSLDPPSSGRELLKAVALLAALLAGFSLGLSRRRRDRVVVGLAIAGLVVAGVVLGLALVGLGPLVSPNRPFVNRNHLAGFSSLCAFATLGLALRARGSTRLLWLMGFVVVAAVVFLALSRGGVGSFLGGIGLFILLAARREERPEESRHGGRIALGAGLAAALGVAAYLALAEVIARLQSTQALGDEEKLALWRPAFQMMREKPLLGIGRGAWEVAFTVFKTQAEVITYTHLENEWLQPLVDLGLPLGLLLVSTLAWLWLRAARRRDLSWVEVGLLAGTAALAAQNLVDFSLEVLGVAIPFALALGLLQRGEGGLKVRWPVLLGGVGAAVVAAAAGMALWLVHPLDRDAASVAQAPTAAAAEARAIALARWHPADWVPVAAVGARWVEEGRCAPAMPWLVRAMRLNPTAPEAHFFAARCLAAAGQDGNAKREYRLAFLFGLNEALGEAARRWPSVEELLQVAPQSADGLLAAAGVLRGQDRRDEATEVLRRVLDEYGDVRALVPLANAAWETKDYDDVLALARRREAVAPLDPEGWRLASLALEKQELADEAGAELERGLTRLPGSPPLVLVKMQRALAVRRFTEAKRLAETMAARTPSELAQREGYIANALAAQGRLSEAIDHLRSAAAADPYATRPLQTLAEYSQQLGRWDDAIAALEHAASVPGQDPSAWAEQLERVKKARADAGDRRRTDELLKGR